MRRGHVSQRRVQARRDVVHAARLIREDEQGLDLGGEPQLAGHIGPKQRLFAGAVAGEHQASLGVVPHGQPEHALQPAHAVGAEARVQRHDRFDVARRTERIAGAGAFVAQLASVVDLAVADHPDRAVRTLERLIAGREIHDGEPAGAQARPLVPDDALPVRAAVRECRGHCRDAVGMFERGARERDGAENAAHYRTTPPPRGGWGGFGGWETPRGRQGP